MSNRTSNYYEGMFVTKGGGGEDAWDQSRSAVKGVLTEHDAEIDYVENWADQQFETEIDKQRRGKYILTYFQADPSSINDIKQDTQMDERILRVLILNREKETTYQEMIQERIEANKEEEEEEEDDQDQEEEETSTDDEEVDVPEVEEESVPEDEIDDVPSVEDDLETDVDAEESEADSEEATSETSETSSDEEMSRTEAGIEES